MISNKTESDLIFDIGLHKGKDARYYVAKGFRVVGLEARPDLSEIVSEEQGDAVRSERLHVVNMALANVGGQRVPFFINPDKDDWGSLYKAAAEKGSGSSFEIVVDTTTLSDLFSRFGWPYYIKCDIEGGDALFVQQLVAHTYRPPFVSVEVNSVEDIARLFSAGYDSFQLVNQQFNWATLPPRPAREGCYVDQRFDGEMSGLFGHELAPDKWIDFVEVVNQLVFWQHLCEKNKRLSEGWLDVHCSMRSTLSLIAV